MKPRLWLLSTFVATGLAFSGILKANASSDEKQIAQDKQQIAQVLANIDRAAMTLDADRFVENLDPRYVQIEKNSPTIHFAQAEQNVRQNYQKTRRYLLSNNHIDQLQIQDNAAIALVTETLTKEIWYDNSHSIFYRSNHVGTEKDVFIRTPNGWKILAVAPIEKKVENGDPQSVNGKLSAQQIATLKANSNVWRVYAHNFINQILIDRMMDNMR